MDRSDAYEVIYWVDAESEQTLVSSFERITIHLHGEDSIVSTPEMLRSIVHDALAQASGSWLMVLDNCVHPALVESWIPKAGYGDVIITMTNSALPAKPGVKIDVGPMYEEEAVALLAKRLHVPGGAGTPEKTLLAKLAREMEFWPLALELAAAYIYAGGIGVRGIPYYLKILKARSLDDTRSIPYDYPRTLVQAVYLCLERIERQSKRSDDSAGIAATAMRFMAYMASRRIPAHLLATFVLMDPEAAGGFSDHRPIFMNAKACSIPEIVANLRSESLVNLDEALPASGVTNSSMPETVVSINLIIQQILRAELDGHRRVHQIFERLAFHLALWLATAHDSSDYPRTLVFAAHAASVEEHAQRLGIDNDYIAFLRGNLAGVARRSGNVAQAMALLRAEIVQLSKKDDEYCRTLCCQACIQLAGILAYDKPSPLGEISTLLERAFATLQWLAPEKPTGVAFLACCMEAVTSALNLEANPPDIENGKRLAELSAVVEDLLARLPETPLTKARSIQREAAAAFRMGDALRAISLCRSVLASGQPVERAESLQHFRLETRRLLIEALIKADDLAGATQEIKKFIVETEPARLFLGVRETLIHNAGIALVAAWLSTYSREVADLLSLIASAQIVEPIEEAFPGVTTARIRLVRAVSALADDQAELAASHLIRPASVLAGGLSRSS